MEKRAEQRLVEAGIGLLDSRGAAALSVRAVEAAAGMPHGSVRHHFGGLSGLRSALVAGLAAAEAPASDAETPGELVRRWLDPETGTARARYELLLMATHDPALRSAFVAGRESFVSAAVGRGIAPERARVLLAMLDGLVLDALLRADGPPDLDLWQELFHSSMPVAQP